MAQASWHHMRLPVYFRSSWLTGPDDVDELDIRNTCQQLKIHNGNLNKNSGYNNVTGSFYLCGIYFALLMNASSIEYLLPEKPSFITENFLWMES